MTKEELISRLKQLSDQKELAAPAYAQHLKDDLFLYALEPEVQKQISEALSASAKESETHVQMFRSAIKSVEDSERHVY